MNPNSLAKLEAWNTEYMRITGLPSLLSNSSLNRCIEALKLAGPIHPGRSIKGEIRARFGQPAVQLLEQVFGLKRLQDT